MADANSGNQDPAKLLPAATLTAVVSGREISLREEGVPLVLVFHAQDTAPDAVEVNKAVRRIHPDPAEVLVASVIDLQSFPSMFRGMVKGELEKAYHNAAGRVPEGNDPADHVVLLPDWDGSVFAALDIKNANAQAAVVVADRQGRILFQAQANDHEDDLGTLAVEALRNL
ncbi:MAG: hypothetical protein ABFS42_05825 [Candidatus Krumholzibacteriota bacterium]